MVVFSLAHELPVQGKSGSWRKTRTTYPVLQREAETDAGSDDDEEHAHSDDASNQLSAELII